MNRIILVGNGFDLAHGLKTSYKDFIIGYLATCFHKVDPWKFDYNDELLSINISHPNTFKSFIRQYLEGKPRSFLLERNELVNFFEVCYKENCLWDLFDLQRSVDFNTINKDKRRFYLEISSILSIKVKSNFLEKIVYSCKDCNWVDIENEYLKACKTKDNLFDKEKVNQLNSEFTFLKQKLEEYLTLQQEQANIKTIPELLNVIGSQFDISDFEPLMGYEDARLELGYDKTIGSEIKHNLYFLNFNYTDTVQKYHDEQSTIPTNFSKIEINYIHGQFNKPDNPIIFGFGDEHDKQYLEFEEHRNNELFEHIKSYQYLRTPNYRNLLMFLNSDNYQVFVMGHACGLSDRTMFKEIFEHENCKSIRLFHYNGDFHDKAINVSKHFSNKGHMRKLVVNCKESDAFPQSKKEDL